jgi:Kef-type K+ transport system membrane component KefB
VSSLVATSADLGADSGLEPFSMIALVLLMAAIVGLVATRLRQPMIVAFIGVGVLVGPVGTGWVVADGTIELLARLGIAVLLFLVGLRLDLHLIRNTGPIALITGLGQVILTAVIGYGGAIAFGMDATAALYVAVALTFSSTIIVVKLLSDKHEIEQLHGRIALGVLIVQDIVVVLVMIVLTAVGHGSGDTNIGLSVVLVVAKGIALLVGVGLMMRYVLPWLLGHIARSQELLVLFGVAYAVGVAALTEWLGFSSEVGAFIAGISLAATPYRDAMGARLVSLRDFLLLFFFLDLGARLEFADAGGQVVEALVFSAFVLIGKPIIVMLIMAVMRYPVRVGFATGATLAQISEFSLILAALGFGLGHIDGATVSLITVVGLITIGCSTYLILYWSAIYDRLERWIAVFERTEKLRPEAVDITPEIDTIVYGLGRFGTHVAEHLSESGHKVLVVDFDPQRVAHHNNRGRPAVFGSAEDVHFLESLPLAQTRYVISTIPVTDTSRTLLHNLRQAKYAGRTVVTAHTRHDAEQLRSAGADVVLEPFALAAGATSDALRTALDALDQDESDSAGVSESGSGESGIDDPAAPLGGVPEEFGHRDTRE